MEMGGKENQCHSFIDGMVFVFLNIYRLLIMVIVQNDRVAILQPTAHPSMFTLYYLRT